MVACMSGARLDVRSVCPEPMAQLHAWHAEAAGVGPDAQAVTVQLATVSAAGAPSLRVRALVVRATVQHRGRSTHAGRADDTAEVDGRAWADVFHERRVPEGAGAGGRAASRDVPALAGAGVAGAV